MRMQTHSWQTQGPWKDIDNTIARIRISRYCPDLANVDAELAAGKTLVLPDGLYRDRDTCEADGLPPKFAFDNNPVDTMPDGEPPQGMLAL